jgi:hypothetical protein
MKTWEKRSCHQEVKRILGRRNSRYNGLLARKDLMSFDCKASSQKLDLYFICIYENKIMKHIKII